MNKDDIISQEKIELLNQKLDEAAIQNEDFRPTVPMIKLTLSTIEGKTEMQVGALIMSLFYVCCIENQIALIDQLKQESVKAMYSAISDKCPEVKNVIDEIINKKKDDDTNDR